MRFRDEFLTVDELTIGCDSSWEEHGEDDQFVDTDYWICTCGQENELTDRCEACGEFIEDSEYAL